MVYEMFSALVDQRGDLAPFEIIEASANQRKAVARQIFDRRREIELAVEPRFHRVLIRGGHIHQVAGFERPQVAAENCRHKPLVARGSAQAGQKLPGRNGEQSENGKRAGPSQDQGRAQKL
jgi:hypothetical protein